MSEKDIVYYDVEERIGYITLNRPEKKNALNFEFVKAIKGALKTALADKESKVLVIRSAADVFCAGADLEFIRKLQTNSFDENRGDSWNLAELFRMIYLSGKIVISQVEGFALAGGCGLATVCDFCYATPQSRFGYTEVKIGFIPAIVVLFLIRKLGEGKARELILTGNIITAEEARQFGLITRVCEAGDIKKEVKEFALKLASETSGESVAMIKKMIADIQDHGFNDGLQYAAHLNAKARATEDCKKGIAAFLNKEKLNW